MKEQVVDNVPKRINELQFGILSNQDIVKQTVLELTDRNVYENINSEGIRALTRSGPMDSRMGISTKTGTCETCGEELRNCNGHFGYIRLPLPAFHIGYLKFIIEILHCICKNCSRVLLEEKRRRSFLQSLRRPNLDGYQRASICKRMAAECKKTKKCTHCGSINGPVRKVPGNPLKIIHNKYDAFNKSMSKNKQPPECKEEFDRSFDAARTANPELDKHMKKAVDDMNPLRVLNLFRRISATDCELFGINPDDGRPEMFIWQYIPAPPVSIRPSVQQENASTEDDITNKLGDILQISMLLRSSLDRGMPVQTIMEQWDYLQLQIAMYINADVPGLQRPEYGRSIRGFCQRLKGKQGRFRGNLSGKRVDFSGRTVISPDPNLSIDEVAVPERVAKNLTYPERVTDYNIEKLRNCVRKGKFVHPGANYVIKTKENNRRIVLEILSKLGRLDSAANDLQVGDVVERHLEDGDIVLFNRQPSLHKLSILSHRAKIRPWRTFRLNECVCNPYNADFDGDEMNLHVPQTEEARTEAMALMGVKHNLGTPKNGTPIIAAIQDFITAAYLLSHKDTFYDRKTFVQICTYMFDGGVIIDPLTGKPMTYSPKKASSHSESSSATIDVTMTDASLADTSTGKDEPIPMTIEIPPPAILKPERLWTGKQIWNVLMRPHKYYPVHVNLDARCKQYKPDPTDPAPDMNKDDAWLVIRNSEVMCGVMDESTVGDGKKDSVFYVIMRDFGVDYAVHAMNRLSKLSARWLTNQGFSIGIGDVYPSAELERQKSILVDEAYAKCDKLISDFSTGKLERQTGKDEQQTLESKISGILSQVRQDAGAVCFQELSKWNSPLIMAKCGSKGSDINVSQMVAGVGQQLINNQRVEDGFQDRTLPHFPKLARQPASKGFIKNSFFSGLTPTEFIFHAMSGREGLVDTAVKTAETGYMSRRLMKSLEDLSAQYDNTVRTSSAGVVQFLYGDDLLDPVDMEGDAKPVNFERTFTHAVNTTWNGERGLYPFEIKRATKEVLDQERTKYLPSTIGSDTFPEKNDGNPRVDQHESVRRFLAEIEAFLRQKADKLARHREKYSLAPGLDSPDVYIDKFGERKNGLPYQVSGQHVSDQINNLPGEKRGLTNKLGKLSESALKFFLGKCLEKYERSKVQPGHAVGAVGAQSIGEPGTQMTLKTFHFAGVAGMNLTQGVPRIKEIINASKAISTPLITCPLQNNRDVAAARIVQARIEKTYIRDIVDRIEEVWQVGGTFVEMFVDFDTIQKLQLDITMRDIERAIRSTKGLKIDPRNFFSSGNRLRVRIDEDTDVGPKKRGRAAAAKNKKEDPLYIKMQAMKRALPNVVIRGYPDAQHAHIKKDDKKNAAGYEEICLYVEGYGLKACMTTEGVQGAKCASNSVMEMLSVLGIEAARKAIINEVSEVMRNMDIDPRHIQLLADVMTYKGDVLGITRFGLAKTRDSVLQLASFEKTPDHLFDAATRFKRDPIEGVSECIIMGQPMKIGTGAFRIVQDLGLPEGTVGKYEDEFEKVFAECKAKGKAAR